MLCKNYTEVTTWGFIASIHNETLCSEYGKCNKWWWVTAPSKFKCETVTMQQIRLMQQNAGSPTTFDTNSL